MYLRSMTAQNVQNIRLSKSNISEDPYVKWELKLTTLCYCNSGILDEILRRSVTSNLYIVLTSHVFFFLQKPTIIHSHDDVIKWKHCPRYWPFVRGIHRSPVNSLHKGQWRGALMFSFICAWINGWVNNREVSNLRRHRTRYDVTVVALLDTHVLFHIIRFTSFESAPVFHDTRRKYPFRTLGFHNTGDIGSSSIIL